MPHLTTGAECTGHAAARLDISHLGTIVQQLFSAGLAPSTKNMYRAGGNHYVKLCERLKLTAFPVTENTLTLFVASLYNDGLSGNTAKIYLIAIGLDDPKHGRDATLGVYDQGIPKVIRRKHSPTPTNNTTDLGETESSLGTGSCSA